MKWRSTNLRFSGGGLKLLLSVIELPIALGLAFATFVTSSLAGCKWARCVDLSGIPWYLGGAALGLTVGAAFWVAMLRLRDRFGRRLVLDALAVGAAIGGYVLPSVVR